MIDYHIHTKLCNHAKNNAKAYIQAGINIGLKEICFLDHLTFRKYNKYSMTPEEVPLYFFAIKKLHYLFKNQINVKVGLEIDFNPAYTDIIEKIVQTYSFDVIGSSLHYIEDINIVSRTSPWAKNQYDVEKMYDLYIRQLDKMLDYDYFDVLCHLDLIKKFGNIKQKLFDKKFDIIIYKIKKKQLTVEINTSGYNHPVKEAYPSLDILKKCRDAEIDIVLGSDAHDPANVGQHYDKIFDLLHIVGYEQISTFSRRKRNIIKI